jgi:hypothetical protein
MTAKVERRSRGTDWIGLLSFGFFLLLLGTVWAMNPNALADEAKVFVKSESWHLKPLTGNLSLPEPTAAPPAFPAIYTAAEQFCLAFGFFEVAILVIRFMLHDHLERKADAVSGIAFWLSAGYFLSLLANDAIPWFAFLAGIIISGGIAITASSLVKLLR